MTASPATKSSLTAWERWELASFDLAAAEAASASPEVSAAATAEALAASAHAEQLARLHETARLEGLQAGHEAGFAAGHAEGLIAGKAEAAERGYAETEKILQLTETFETRLAELNQVVADDLVALSIALAEQIVRETVATRPDVLLSVVREALGQLPLQHAAIHLNPEDASLIRSRAGDQLAHAGHRIHEDPKLARGDVVIESGGTHLDATLATRWRRTLDALGHDTPWLEADAAK
jgi:flagellar assembly protein FliH